MGAYDGSDRDERELQACRAELRELLLEMELHHERDSEAVFEEWWRSKGNERRYFERKRQLEIREETIYRMRMLAELEPERQGDTAQGAGGTGGEEE